MTSIHDVVVINEMHGILQDYRGGILSSSDTLKKLAVLFMELQEKKL